LASRLDFRHGRRWSKWPRSGVIACSSFDRLYQVTL